MNKHKPQLFEGGLREHRGNCILASAAIPKFALDCLHCLKLMEVPLANNMKTGLGILGKKLSPNFVPRRVSLFLQERTTVATGHVENICQQG